MKFMIVNAFGRSNRGDSVLLDECIHEIRARFPDAEIAGAVFEGIEAARAVHPTVAWSERIGNAPAGAAGRLKAILYLLAAWFSAWLPLLGRLLPERQRRTLDAIRQSDVVISAPGGYIHDTNFAYFIALLHIHLGTIMGKTVVLAPQSVGPIARPISRAVARHVLGKVPYLCARESYSWDFLALDLKLPEKNVYRTGDSAFWNSHVEDDPAPIDAIFDGLGIAQDTPVFGMTVVKWSFPKSRTPAEELDRYTDAMARAAEHMSETYGLQPVIFNQVSEDLPASLDVQRKARCRVIVDETSREPDILRAMIARSRVFLGTRFHSCIFAMMAGRPTFAIAYLPKTEYIMNDLKLPHRHTPIDAIDFPYLIKRISEDHENLNQAEAEIRDAVSVYRRNFTRLQDILGLIGAKR
ncbi:MAG: polysaccharide pyruvyl transferase family protein [Rhizobiaceae bacterium]|nr:polysaccharide pyruvyl transferase family protein [Rhizobiaceae bacterium]